MEIIIQILMDLYENGDVHNILQSKIVPKHSRLMTISNFFGMILRAGV